LLSTKQIVSALFILFCSLDKYFWLKTRVYDDLNAKEIDTPCKCDRTITNQYLCCVICRAKKKQRIVANYT
ncbi:hypothetical protein, partial [Serratia surfactantfaciens]|uniref:hypothetical protein n=1 Tax=Serratia surfactantfaciens TaxID=2741499 RepID=UPI001B3C55A1